MQPAVGPLINYVDYISKLPDEDPTDIFGLHSNANINYQNNESHQVI